MADLDLQCLAERASHLERAVLRVLTAHSIAEMPRQRFEEALAQDAWVERNEHRLARLESTLAVMAGRGLLRITGGGLEVLHPGVIVAELTGRDAV